MNVEWVVNDNAELGVKIEDQFFWLYKGASLIVQKGLHDDGTPMLYRPVGKREFGECCHPIHLETLPERYTEGEGWKPIKPDLDPVIIENPKDAPHWFIDYTHGHAEYVGDDVEDYAKKLAETLKLQVNIYRMNYSFSVKSH